MECNKDEALRAKSIAEEKFTKKDFIGARKFALKAQTLYPGLDGISQMLTTLDVYVSAENKVSGETDWYGVLGVNPSADDESIKKQFKKFALLLHPDKNKSLGAEGAFKLVSEAFSFLSDKQKRLAYNQRRGARVFQQRAPVHTAGSGSHHRAPVNNGGSGSHQRAPVHTGGSGSHQRGPFQMGGSGSHQGAPFQMGGSGFHQRTPVHTGGLGTNQRNPAHTGGPSASTQANGSVPSRPNGHSNFASRNGSASKTQGNSKKAEPPPNPSTPSHQRPDTFWTICHRCKIHYEYLKAYLNSTLLCPNCKQPFTAKETSPPANYPKSSNAAPKQQQQSASSDRIPDRKAQTLGRNEPAAKQPVPPPSQGSLSSSKLPQYHQDPFSGMSSVRSTDASIAAKAASVVQEAQNKLKRSYAESNASAGSKEFKPSVGWNEFIKHRKIEDNISRYGMSYASTNAQGNVSFGPASGTANGLRIYGFSGPYGQPSIPGELTPMEIRNMLTAWGRKEVLDKLNQKKTENAAKSARQVKEQSKSADKERNKKDDIVKVCDQNGKTDLPATKSADQPEKDQANNSSDDDEANEDAQDASMTVADPDFHDFDQDRTENTFGENEVWAAYDDDDGMPRFYAFIGKVISRDPFKLKIGWLNSKMNGEFSSIDWVASGFYKTCGEFRVGKYETCKNINSFSQKINWVKGPRGSILILPKKGDVWALYQNWSPDWDEHTPDEVIHKYDMVMVLDDYNEEKGVPAAPLVKVAGFKTVFRPNSDNEAIKTIPKEEMFRFSHRVPNHVLTGYEAPNAPKGYVELDPAATPLELLQVIKEETDVDQKNGIK